MKSLSKNWKLAWSLLIGLLVILFIGVILLNNSDRIRKKETMYIRAVLDEYRNTSAVNKEYSTNGIAIDIQNNVKKLAQVRYDSSLSSGQKISSLNDLKYSSTMARSPKAYQFYVNYYLAQLYNAELNPDSTLQNVIAANNTISDDINNYKEEYQKLENMIMILKQLAFGSDSNSTPMTIDYNLSQSHSNSERASKIYSTALLLMQDKKYSQCISYLHQALPHLDKINDMIQKVKCYSLLQNAYGKLHDIHSMDSVDQYVEHMYSIGSIKLSDYMQYAVSALEGQIGNKNPDTIESRFIQLYQYFLNNPGHENSLVQLYKTEINYYKQFHYYEKEKDALIKGLQFAKQNDGELSLNIINLKKEIIDQLIDLDLQMHNKKDVMQWYNERLETRHLQSEFSNFASQLNFFLSERDLNNAQRQLEQQKEKINAKKQINILYVFLIILFVLGMFYTINLYKKNIQYNERLQIGAKILQSQYDEISEQNQLMNTLVQKLKISNENLENFALVAAHDIKSPISSINIAVNYLKEQYQNKLEPSVKDNFDNLHTSTLDLCNMINELLSQSNRK